MDEESKSYNQIISELMLLLMQVDSIDPDEAELNKDSFLDNNGERIYY